MTTTARTHPALRGETLHLLAGLEPDNLLSVLALLGLLRTLEGEAPAWRPRASWEGPPWRARLHLSHPATRDEVAAKASAGVERIASQFRLGGRKKVDFERDEYRDLARRSLSGPVPAALATALTVEHPEKRGGGLRAAPLVLMSGQGHQFFLERLVSVPLGRLPKSRKRVKSPPDLRDPRFIAEALFHPWRREDPTEGFRWDPEEDQRYALRFGKPSSEGAASTVHGANRLAAIGLLSFPCAPGAPDPGVPGVRRDRQGIAFVWPIWTEPLSLVGIERLLNRRDLLDLERERLAVLGVAEIYSARRVANGKLINVTRGSPARFLVPRRSSP